MRNKISNIKYNSPTLTKCRPIQLKACRNTKLKHQAKMFYILSFNHKYLKIRFLIKISIIHTNSKKNISLLGKS